jgi:multidrug resistance efflux pump
MKHPNPRLLIPIALLLALGGGGWYIETQRARQRSTLSGFFESQPTQVASRTGGRVARILVKEGDTVHVGQPLMELEATPAKQDTAAKQATAEQARQQLREVVNGPRPEDIRKQEEVVAEMTASLARLRNGPLPEDIRAAQARLRRAEAQYQKAQAGARPEEIAQARAAERAARAKLAQAERGLTPEEKAQAKARLDAAVAQETLARSDLERYRYLFDQGAISRQQWDQAQTSLRQAEASRQELEEAWSRAEEGTPAEEMEQARQSHQEAQAALDLVLAGSRREDIQAAAADVAEARQNLNLLLRGSRQEDIRAAEARLAQAHTALEELRAGSRKEQIAQAQAAAKSAQATAKSSESSVVEWTIRAPQDGIVERIPVAKGDLLGAGSTVLRLANPQDIWIRIFVPESGLTNVRAGSDAELKIDGISEPLAATVESVATQGEFTPANLQTPDERGKQVFGVRLRLKQPDPRVKAGMYATVKRIGPWQP